MASIVNSCKTISRMLVVNQSLMSSGHSTRASRMLVINQSLVSSGHTTRASRMLVINQSLVSSGHTTRSFYTYLKKRRKPKVAVLNLSGMIMSDVGPQSRMKKLNLASLEKPIKKIFDTKNLKEVCLLINSPGGSPVQSDLIANRITHLSKSKNVEVVSFVEDLAASGGYWLACIGKEIYVTENSIAGSIGVVSGGFGFHDFIKRYDVERRVHQMGKNKTLMDPFQPQTPEAKEVIDRNLKRIYMNFVNYVKRQRGEKLKADDDVLFTGEYWVGEDAVGLGLVDGIKTLNDYLYEKYGDDVDVIHFNRKSGGLSALLGSASSLSDLEHNLMYSELNSKYKIF